MPLDAESLTCMGIELHIALSSFACRCATFVVIKDPHLYFSIVGRGGKKSIFEGVPLQVLNVSSMALQERSSRVEVLSLVCVDDGDGGCGCPSHGNHLAIGGHTVLLVAAAHVSLIHCDEVFELQMLETPRVINYIHHALILLSLYFFAI